MFGINCQLSVDNDSPYVGDSPQHTASQCEMALSIFYLVLVDREDPGAKDLCLGFDDCCALMCVVRGVQEALRDVVDRLDGYSQKA